MVALRPPRKVSHRAVLWTSATCRLEGIVHRSDVVLSPAVRSRIHQRKAACGEIYLSSTPEDSDFASASVT